MNSREQNRALNSAEYSSQATVLRSMPVRAWLAFTGRCNLNCAHCPRRSYAEGIQVGPDMSEKVFEKVMEKILPFLYDCKVGGNNLGEQLLAKEWNGFRQKLEENEFTRCLVTNGVLLTSERAEKLIKGGWILDISVEGATAETYKKIRNVEFGRFIDMVTECCRIKNSEVKTESRIRLCFTAFYDNIEELPLLVKLAGEMGVDEVMVTHLIPLRESQRNQSLVYHKGLYNKIRA
ncbi:radical SAM protein, partial [bacterium]|nr:radical SAM protein [bacterium]